MNISQEAIKISQEAERFVLHNYTPSAGLVQKKKFNFKAQNISNIEKENSCQKS